MDWEKCKPGSVVYRIEDDGYKKGIVHKMIRKNGTITQAQVTFQNNESPHKRQNRTVNIAQIYFKEKSKEKFKPFIVM